MEAIVGVFPTSSGAQRAVTALHAILPVQQISVLTPASSTAEVESVGATDDMPPVAAYLAGALGGALGMGWAATVLLPGLGLFTVVGAAAVALAGALGAVLIGRAGAAADNAAFSGLPRDELMLYEDALRQGRTVVIAVARDMQEAAAVRGALEVAGAESLDVARGNWRVGMEDAKDLTYEKPAEEPAHAHSR